MLAKELISDQIPLLKTSDTGESALLLMDEYKLTELPIVNNSEFLGMITESDILDLHDPKVPIGNHKLSLEKPSVNENDHIYEVLAKISNLNLSAIPILNNDKVYLGSISLPILVSAISNLAAINDIGGILQLEINEIDYSLSEISSIVESNGGKILSLYIRTHDDSLKMDVTLKINKPDLSPIIQTFERYNYTVAASFHKSEYQEELKHNYDQFLKYLNM